MSGLTFGQFQQYLRETIIDLEEFENSLIDVQGLTEDQLGQIQYHLSKFKNKLNAQLIHTTSYINDNTSNFQEFERNAANINWAEFEPSRSNPFFLIRKSLGFEN